MSTEEGATAIEYGLLATLIALVLIPTIWFLSAMISTEFYKVWAVLANANLIAFG